MSLFKRKTKSKNNAKIYIDEKTKNSQFEDYNRLKDNLLYISTDGSRKVIQVESSVMSEGKTTLVGNLAVSLGQTNKKVLVIDLDFRRPKIHRLFSYTKDNGISDYFLGKITKEEMIKKTKYNNVDIITRGAPVYNSSLLLLSDKFKNLIAELRNEYDFIFLDCAPVLQVSDYIHISKVSDGVLFLVAYASTTKTQVVEAIKELKKNGADILGSVFTMYDVNKDGSYYKGSYYKGSYYKYQEEEGQFFDEDQYLEEDLQKEPEKN